jgi:iron complex outermembrane receptor protein
MAIAVCKLITVQGGFFYGHYKQRKGMGKPLICRFIGYEHYVAFWVLLLLLGWPVPVWSVEPLTSHSEQQTVPDEGVTAPDDELPLTELSELEVTGTKEIEPSSKDGSAENGYRVKSASMGALGEKSLQDTPYSINVISSDFMENLQAQSVADALKYNPTVSSGSGANGVGGGAGFQIRGFHTQTNESFIDGLRIYSRTPVEDKERIEVINGPAGFLYGISNSAGVINYVLKRPTDTPLLNVTIGNYGGEQGYIHGDLGGPIDSAGKFGYRLNLLYVGDGDTGIDDQTHERYLISGAFDWHISPDTLLSMDYSLFDIQINHGDDIFKIGSDVTTIPDAPDAAKNYMPDYSFAEDRYSRFGIKLTSKLSEVFSLRSAFAYSDTNRYRHRAKVIIINNAGDYTMTRNYYDTDRLVSEGYLFFDADFDTGPVGHKVTVGLTEEYSEIKYAYPFT